jgi:hypothetical protein
MTSWEHDGSGGPQGLATRQAATLKSLRATTMGRVREATAVMSREVMAAASSVARAVDGIYQHMGDVRSMLASVEGTDGNGGVAAALERHGTVLSHFSRSIANEASRQEAVASRAKEQIALIARAASDTANLTSAARLLALNARVEASRTHPSGAAFGVIAREMQQLAEQISRTNSIIDDVSRRLREDLPVVAESAQTLKKSAEGLREDLGASATEAEAQIHQLRALVRDAVARGDEDIGKILAASQDAMSHLQFQDVVEQSLLRLDRHFYVAQVEHAEETGLGDEIGLVDPPVHDEIGGDKAVDQENAGDVLLF